MNRASSPPLTSQRHRLRAFDGVLLSLHLITTGVALTAALPAAAQESNPAAPVLLLVDNVPPHLDVDKLRAAIAREIGVSVTRAVTAPSDADTLTLRGAGERQIHVAYRAADGRITERDLDLPDDEDRAIELVSLLAGNLVRDEAAELGAAFKKRADKPSPPVEPTRVVTSACPGGLPCPAPAAIAPAPSPANAPAPSACARRDIPSIFAGVDFVPFVGTSSVVGAGVSRHLALNVLAGYAAGLRGFEVGGLVNIESEFVCGFQAAGIANLTSGPLGGFQAAGIANLTRGPVRGFQAAGVANVGKRLDGAQISLVNVVTEDVVGLETGLVNWAGGDLTGAQLGLVDVVHGESSGGQVGLANVAGGAVNGAQFGLLNVAAGSVRGAQIGLINVATGSVRGAQLGLLNVANTSSFSLGLLSIFRAGSVHVDVWGQESGLLMAGLKHGSGYFHGIYGVGVLPFGGKTRFAGALGFGAHLPFSDPLFVDVDLLDYALAGSTSLAATTNIAQGRVILGLRLADWLSIFGGPSYNVATTWSGADPGISPYGVNFTERGTSFRAQGWPGVVLGIQAL